MNTGELVKKFIGLRDYVDARTKAFEAEIKPYKDGMAAIEAACAQQLIDLDADNIKTEHGTVYRSKTLAVKMVDRETFMQFVADDFGERSAFLTSAVTKDVVKDWIEQNNALPPGLDVTTLIKTNFRRS